MSFSQQRTPEWHTQRSGKVTASVCGTIIGVNKHQPPHALWEQLTGRNPPFGGNYFTWWGTKNEPNALNEYMQQTLHSVEEVGFRVHQHYLWLGGSPDGLVGSDGVVEFKCPSTKIMYEDNTIPLHYYVQCQVLMEVTDRSWCDLFVWTRAETRRWHLTRDTEFFASICPILAAFHAKMATDLCPQPINIDTNKLTRASLEQHIVPCVQMEESPFSKHPSSGQWDS